MYNERTNFSIKNVIIQFLFIALFVFILIWLFPLKSDLKNMGSKDSIDLSVLTDRIFNENILAMKEAAKSYYTLERLPQNVGDKVKMTLGEMLDKKIILPFTDKNGDACSLTDSYVEVTKYDTEYLMKVNLKCGEEENYLLVYMGCYDYCSTTICEKNKSDISSPVIYSAKKQQKTNIINKIVNIVNPQPEKPKPEKPQPEKKYYCQFVNGKYYDETGKVVNVDEYKKSCESSPVTVEYLYEYSKTKPAKCTESDWSNWSTKAVNANSTTSVQTKTVTKKKLIGYNVKTTTDYSKPIYGTKNVVTGTTTKNVCVSYGYVATGEYSYSDWTYAGIVFVNDPSPSNTTTVQYIKINEDDWRCSGKCVAGSTYGFEKYTRTKTPITKYQCTKWEKQTVNVTTPIQVVTGYETTTTKTPVYETVSTKYYRYKTKTCTKESKDIKWSYYNDTSLLNTGYSYTGNKKQK